MLGRLIVVLVTVLMFGSVAGAPPAQAQQATPCDSGSGGSFSKVSAAPKYDILPQEVVRIASPLDGVMIQMAILRPDVPEGVKVPVIVDAGPYFHPMQDLDLRRCMGRFTENFVAQGYAVALIAVRGTADSGGCFNFFGPKEQADLDHAITWLGERPWSSGAVGMIGKSYDGTTPWEVAAAGNPHLKTIVPVSGVPDIFELLYGGGVNDFRGVSTVLNNVYYGQSAAFYAPGRSVQSTVEVTACPEYADGNAAALQSGRTGELDTFGYWGQRRLKQAVEENYDGSILLVQGLLDWNVNPGLQFPWVPDMVARSRAAHAGRPECEGDVRRYAAEPDCGMEVKYVLGQWGHSYPDQPGGAAKRNDWADMLLGWFDYYLKGNRSADLGAVVDVQDSAGQWRHSTAWPAPGTATTWHMTGDGKLASSPSTATSTANLVADPGHTQGGNDPRDSSEPLRTQCSPPLCATFTTPAFASAYRFSGLPQLKLRVTPQASEGQLSSYLYAVAADGTSKRIGWGQVDLRFPKGKPSGDPKATPVVAGLPMTVDFPLQPLEAVVAAGSRLVLVVSQGSAYNRLVGAPAPITLHSGGAASALTVNAVEPAATDFFIPRPAQ